MSKHNKIGIDGRADWGDFSEVMRNGNLGDLEARPGYEAAKHGDSKAAPDMVESIVSPIQSFTQSRIGFF